MTTARLETFSDGVFAIAATLLILDVRVSGSNISHELIRIWPSYAAYAISFLTIGIMWVNHHVVFEQIERVDRTFLFLNMGFLMLVAFVPFPARLIAEHLRGDEATPSALAYGFTFTLTAIFYNAVWFYAARGKRLLKEDADPVLVALISPVVSVTLFGAIGIFYVLESSIFGREKPHRRP